jgi:hypothetical protein
MVQGSKKLRLLVCDDEEEEVEEEDEEESAAGTKGRTVVVSRLVKGVFCMAA